MPAFQHFPVARPSQISLEGLLDVFFGRYDGLLGGLNHYLIRGVSPWRLLFHVA
jgi:hypothetical protein